MLAINGRFQGAVASGVQRTAASYLKHIATPHRIIEPRRPMLGLKGHLWEQIALPLRLGDAPLWSPCNVGPLAMRNQVVTIHDAVVFDHPEWFSRSFVKTYQALLPRLARSTKRIVTVSHFSRERLIAALGVDPKKIDVVWNGVDSHFVPASPADQVEARKAAGLTAQRYVITLSTLEPRKNLATVLAAWRLARPRLPSDYALVVVGKQGSARIFGESAQNNAEPGVHYTGYLAEDHLPGIISGADCLLYPSLYEGFGLPVVEGMACGVPVITSAHSSLPEVGGDAAIYVEPRDAPAMASEIVRLATETSYRSDRSELGLAQAKKFGWQAAAQSMDTILRDSLEF